MINTLKNDPCAALRHLTRAVECLDLYINIVRANFPQVGFSQIHIHTRFGHFECIVDDEYDDLPRNPVAALQVILLTMLDFQDGQGESFQVISEHPNAAQSLNEFWQLYCDKIANPECIVSPYEWSLNCDEAKKVRDLQGNAEPFTPEFPEPI